MNFFKFNKSILNISKLINYHNYKSIQNKQFLTLPQYFVKIASNYSSNTSDEELDNYLSQIKKDFESQLEANTGTALSSTASQENNIDELANTWSQISRTSYENFDLSKSRVIYDSIEEELGLVEAEDDYIEPEEEVIHPIDLKRGKKGVLDLHQLIDILKDQKAKDIVAMKLPKEARYADHMVVISASSQRHLDAIAMSVRKYYLRLKKKKDPAILLEGKGSKWIATDLGNIILHMMSPTMRQRMDLEALWLLGSEHDDKTHEIQDVDEYSSFIFNLDDENFTLDNFEAEDDSKDDSEEMSQQNNATESAVSTELFTNENSEISTLTNLSTNQVYENYIKSINNS